MARDRKRKSKTSEGESDEVMAVHLAAEPATPQSTNGVVPTPKVFFSFCLNFMHFE